MNRYKLFFLFIAVILFIFFFTGNILVSDSESSSLKEIRRNFLPDNYIIIEIFKNKGNNGIFNKQTLTCIYELTEYAKKAYSPEDSLSEDIITLSTFKSVNHAGIGEFISGMIMSAPPYSSESILKIKEKISDIPFFKDTIVSSDFKAVRLLFPVKKENYSILYSKLLKKIQKFKGDEIFLINSSQINHGYYSQHFSGNELFFLCFTQNDYKDISEYVDDFTKRFEDYGNKLQDKISVEKIFPQIIDEAYQYKDIKDRNELLINLAEFISHYIESEDTADTFMWEEALAFIENEKNRNDFFAQPELLLYIENLIKSLTDSKVIVSSLSFCDLIKTLNKESFLGRNEYYCIPETCKIIKQQITKYNTLSQFNIMKYFISADLKKMNLFLLLNRNCLKNRLILSTKINEFMKLNKCPFPLKYQIVKAEG